MLYIQNDVINLTRGDDATMLVPICGIDGNLFVIGPEDYLIFGARTAPAGAGKSVLEIVGEPGESCINFTHADTADLEPGFYSAEIQLMLKDGQRVTIWPKLTGNRRVSEDNWCNFCIMREVVTL